MIINGVYYPIIGKIEFEEAEERKLVPVVDVPMMSDERWKELTNTPEQVEYRKQILRMKEVIEGDTAV